MMAHAGQDVGVNEPAQPAIHPDVEPLAFLLGTWRGEGTGFYPTVEDFAYVEEVEFGHGGKPMLTYSQRTRDATSGEPRHAEVGFWRVVGQGRLEIVLAHPTGAVEVSEGSFDGTHLEVRSTIVSLTTTAKRVDAIRRVFDVEPAEGTLTYRLDMAAVGQALQPHLEATLHRV